MLTPFRLKRPIGPDSIMDLDDVLAAKRALGTLGHYRVPKYGLTPYPDEPLIASVRSFQRENGLREDGVMKPDGPTVATLGRVLDRQWRQRPVPGIVEGERDRTQKRLPHRTPFPDPVPLTGSQDRGGPPSVFDVLGGVGRSRANHPRDVLALRRALAWAGHLPRHEAIDATEAGDDLIAATERFQKAAGVKTDGFVGPGGETARALDNAIAAKVKEHLLKASGEDTGNDAAAKVPDQDGPRIAMAPKPKPGGVSGATEGALIPSPFSGIGGGGAAIGTAIGAGIATQELLRQQQKKQGIGEVPPPPEPGAARPRTDMAPSVPPTPGLEPPDDGDRLPTKTESPVQMVEVPDLSQPLPKVDKPTIFVHPLPPEDLREGMVIERKGNEVTRKELERIRDFYEGNGWKHVAGGRFSEKHQLVLEGKKNAGDEQEERHIKGHFGSLKGGHFTDLTFETPDGRIVHVQTVDVDRNGKPSQREIDTAERIRRAVKDEHILLIPKGAQLEKVRRFRTPRQ